VAVACHSTGKSIKNAQKNGLKERCKLYNQPTTSPTITKGKNRLLMVADCHTFFPPYK
jgi:hypothetical protein